MSSPDRKRPQRVGELLQHELADLITNQLKDPRVGFVTVTEVRVTNDLRLAKVFVSIYGTPEERAGSLEGLRKAAGYLKHELAGRIDLRYVPELVFTADETLDQADRLETLIQAIAHGETEPPPPAAREPVAAHTHRSELADSRRNFEEAQRREPKKGQPRTKGRRRR